MITLPLTKSWLPDFLDKNASKKEEKVIKELLINEYNIATTKGIYIQGYSIDINKFISNDIVDYKKCFLVYKNEKVPVKTFYYEEIIPS